MTTGDTSAPAIRSTSTSGRVSVRAFHELDRSGRRRRLVPRGMCGSAERVPRSAVMRSLAFREGRPFGPFETDEGWAAHQLYRPARVRG